MSLSFFLDRQESLAQDSFSRNGRNKELHIVAKQIPFTVHLAATVDLHLHPITASLIYDFEDPENNTEQREVETVKTSPIDYMAHVSKAGDKAAVEVKLFVLSSQHEGAYFRIKFTAASSLSPDVLYRAFSHPIKVVAKRTQVRRIIAARSEMKLGDSDATKSPGSPSPSPSPASPPPPKRSPLDMIADTLNRMETQQRDQAKILETLYANSTSFPVISQPVPVPDPDDMDFEVAFQAFLHSFKKVSKEERPRKLRKVISAIPSQDMEVFAEVIELCSSEIGDSGSNHQLQGHLNHILDRLVSSSSVVYSPISSSSLMYDETLSDICSDSARELESSMDFLNDDCLILSAK